MVTERWEKHLVDPSSPVDISVLLGCDHLSGRPGAGEVAPRSTLRGRPAGVLTRWAAADRILVEDGVQLLRRCDVEAFWTDDAG